MASSAGTLSTDDDDDKLGLNSLELKWREHCIYLQDKEDLENFRKRHARRAEEREREPINWSSAISLKKSYESEKTCNEFLDSLICRQNERARTLQIERVESEKLLKLLTSQRSQTEDAIQELKEKYKKKIERRERKIEKKIEEIQEKEKLRRIKDNEGSIHDEVQKSVTSDGRTKVAEAAQSALQGDASSSKVMEKLNIVNKEYEICTELCQAFPEIGSHVFVALKGSNALRDGMDILNAVEDLVNMKKIDPARATMFKRKYIDLKERTNMTVKTFLKQQALKDPGTKCLEEQYAFDDDGEFKPCIPNGSRLPDSSRDKCEPEKVKNFASNVALAQTKMKVYQDADEVHEHLSVVDREISKKSDKAIKIPCDRHHEDVKEEQHKMEQWLSFFAEINKTAQKKRNRVIGTGEFQNTELQAWIAEKDLSRGGIHVQNAASSAAT